MIQQVWTQAVAALFCIAGCTFAYGDRILTSHNGFQPVSGPLNVYQAGTSNVLGVIQFGPTADLSIIQRSPYNRVVVIQSGDTADVDITQIQGINQAFVIQIGQDPTALVVQNGTLTTVVGIQDENSEIAGFSDRRLDELVLNLLFAPETLSAPARIGTDLALSLTGSLRDRQAFNHFTRCVVLEESDASDCAIAQYFLETSYRANDRDDQLGAIGFKSDTASIRFGVEHDITSSFRVGIAVGVDTIWSDINHDLGSINTKAVQLAAYGSWLRPADTGDILLNFGASMGTAYYDTKRFGVRGSTDSNIASLYGELAYLFRLQPDRWKVGPILTLSYAQADVDGYREKGNPLFAQIIPNTQREDTYGAIGVLGFFAGNQIAGVMRADYVFDLGGDDDDILESRFVFTPETMIYTPVARRSESDYVRLLGGIDTRLSSDVTVGFKIGGTLGSDDRNDFFLSAHAELAY